MASLFRPSYTTTDSTTGQRVKRRSRKWYGQYRDASGKTRRVPLSTDKGAAQVMLADLVRQAQQGQTPAGQDRRALSVHLDDWQAAQETRGVSTAQTRLNLYRVRRVVKVCGWQKLSDMTASSAETALAGMVGPKGISAKTRNDYVTTLRCFANWLTFDNRLTESPFKRLKHVSITRDRRHDRRPLTGAELVRLLTAAQASARAFRGLDGRDRHALYLCAVSTGFRAGELAALTPAAFAFHESPPVIKLGAEHTKNKKSVVQPVPIDVADVLAAYLVGHVDALPVWPGGWIDDASEMVAADLGEAGIAYITQGPDGPLFADFHALRHSFVALLDQPGVTLKQAMTLARHSDPRLTMKRYGKAAMADLGKTVNATHADLALNSCLNLAQASGADRGDAMGIGGPAGNSGPPIAPAVRGGMETIEVAQGGSGGAAPAEDATGSPTRGRTAFSPSETAALAQNLGLDPDDLAMALELVRRLRGRAA